MPVETAVAQCVEKNPWAWGWDAWVAIGTIILAAVTVLAIVIPILLDHARQREKNRLHVLMFDHELSVIEGIMKTRAYQTLVPPNTPRGVQTVLLTLRISHPLIAMPLTERLVDDLVHLGEKIADPVAVVLSATMQIRKNMPPESLQGVPVEDVKRLTRNANREALTVLHQARAAREALRTVRRKVKPLPVMDAIHENLASAYKSVIADAKKRQSGEDVIE